MRQEINEHELESVTGGTVFISRDKMRVGFSSSGRKYKLVNCTFRQANDLAQDLWEANQTLGDAAFDALVESTMDEKGWLESL